MRGQRKLRLRQPLQDLRTRRRQPEIQVPRPEHVIEILRHVLALVLHGEVPGQVQGVDDLLDVGDALLHFLLVRSQMSGDEQEGSTEDHERRRDRALGLEGDAGSHRQ